MELKDIFVVLSRDQGGFIYVTFDEKDADSIKASQTKSEEMAGGRPSVYIKKTRVLC